MKGKDVVACGTGIRRRERYSALEERRIWHFFVGELRAGNANARRRPTQNFWRLYQQVQPTTKKSSGLESHFRKYMIPRVHLADVCLQDISLLLRFFKAKLNLPQKISLERKFNCSIKTDKIGYFVSVSFTNDSNLIYPSVEDETIISNFETQVKVEPIDIDEDFMTDSDEEFEHQSVVSVTTKQMRKNTTKSSIKDKSFSDDDDDILSCSNEEIEPQTSSKLNKLKDTRVIFTPGKKTKPIVQNKPSSDDDLVIDENSEILSIPSDGKEKNGNQEIERLSSPDGSYETSNEKETSNEQLVNLEISTGQNGVDVPPIDINEDDFDSDRDIEHHEHPSMRSNRSSEQYTISTTIGDDVREQASKDGRSNEEELRTIVEVLNGKRGIDNLLETEREGLEWLARNDDNEHRLTYES